MTSAVSQEVISSKVTTTHILIICKILHFRENDTAIIGILNQFSDPENFRFISSAGKNSNGNSPDAMIKELWLSIYLA